MKVVKLPEPPDPWRLRWIEASIKDINEVKLADIRSTIKDHGDQLTKINRNVLILGFAIMGLGVASKVFEGPIAELVKNILGL